MLQKVFEETFVSPFEKDTKDDALKVLKEIRTCHPASKGWEELEGYAMQKPNGKWIAVRKHRHRHPDT